MDDKYAYMTNVGVGWQRKSLLPMCIYVYVYVNFYVYTEREKERETESERFRMGRLEKGISRQT